MAGLVLAFVLGAVAGYAVTVTTIHIRRRRGVSALVHRRDDGSWAAVVADPRGVVVATWDSLNYRWTGWPDWAPDDVREAAEARVLEATTEVTA